MHLLLSEADGGEPLAAEIRRAFPSARLEAPAPDLLVAKELPEGRDALPPLVFARQVLPEARAIAAPSIKGLADLLFETLVPQLPEAAPWRLHLVPHYGTPGSGAGGQRCRLVRDALVDRLRRQRRHLLRRLSDATQPFAPDESLVQLLLTGPALGFLSVAPAPVPAVQRAVLSPFPAGLVPVAVDKSAPSRAFAKLLEAELRLGRAIAPGETCVDLGASPGSWTYLALRRGARVEAVDRSPLREDLHRHPALRFHQGDAFRFQPAAPVDWLLCDVIAAPERSIGLVLDWTRERRCRRFVVTVKFKGTAEYPLLDALKAALPGVCSRFLLTRLCANKNEACALGEVASDGGGAPVGRRDAPMDTAAAGP